ncbi:MAG: TetR/AcrR family transcriptional regulator [Pseudomonadales bacterium]|jgi:AcrR family transcriptional regulator|nr:TetR/AcrR family transcriptional regulator [Pseudomonadales bacterium]MDP6469716.1 TetR/AcrR family transcriptional regulator [Pseudomonadales bacterium]MDP6827683.1 TetR/AcrR family transcriptional regulator [Pseudomonadales bacterium]MDP6971877.1 TetR/AcrR family transcriptional regulator [Pseudomonadales bacterium]|tara:strand:- start:650 stop:1273 length:624 start_codon:yes stop_codon:yes gene_type:complete
MNVQTKVASRRTQLQRRTEAEYALLDAAAELFAERGVVQTSLAQIGERAGYSRGLVNHHFGTKDALIMRLAEHAQAACSETLEGFEADTGLHGVLTLADEYLKVCESPSRQTRAFHVMWGESLNESAHNIFAEADDRSRDTIVGWVRKGQRDGSISKQIAARPFALLLLGLMRGVATQLLTAPGAVESSKLRAQTRSLIRTACASRH